MKLFSIININLIKPVDLFYYLCYNADTVMKGLVN